MDQKVERQVKDAIEKGKDREGNEHHAERKKERMEFETEASRLMGLLEQNSQKLDQLPYMTPNQLLVVLADVARLQIEATRLVLEKKMKV